MSATTVMTERRWFLDTLVVVRVSHDTGEDGISIIESVAPYGDSPPLHVHRTEDELFHLLEGTMRWQVGDDEFVTEAGAVFLAPKGIPHTYRVESVEGARWLVTTTRGDFEAMVRAASRPAERDALPEPNGPPTPDQQAALAAVCEANGIGLVGPPLH
jgi:quercetin dioxygenase-like cupin family protein